MSDAKKAARTKTEAAVYEEELKELRSRETKTIAAILKIAGEMRPILSDDLVQFPSREVRRRFVADPVFAESFDDERIATLKAGIVRRAGEIRDRIMASMEPGEPWLAGVGFPEAGKSLAENTVLWEPTREIGRLVEELLVEYRFPDAGATVEYKMPTWFIAGKFLPGLAEKYWALIEELREVRERIAELEQSRVRESLARRWDKL